MVKRIGGDVFGELLETGKAVAKQAKKQISPVKIAKTAAQQIKGSSKQKFPKKLEGKSLGSQMGAKSSGGIEGLLPKAVGGEQMKELKQNDAIKSRKELDKTRSGLAQIKIRRYQEMQRKVLEAGKEKDQEIRAYEAGKPGSPRTWKEKEEMIEEQQEKAKEQEGKAIAPITSKQSKGMRSGARVKQKQGSREIGKKLMG